MNLVYNVRFNQEVSQDAALYWTKESGNLASLIDKIDSIPTDKSLELHNAALKRIHDVYNWPSIIGQYETVFCWIRN